MRFPPGDARNLGRLVASSRRNRGWSQREVAERACVSAAFLSKIECGRLRAPSHGPLLAVAAVLEVDLDRSWEDAPLRAAVDEGGLLARFETVPNYGPLDGPGRLELATTSRVRPIPRRAALTIEIRFPETDVSVESFGDKTLVRLDYTRSPEVSIRGRPTHE